MNTEKADDGIFEINITPFVDIVLVLLIIFMISTPAMVYKGLKVTLPKAVNGQDLSHVTLKISIGKDGQLGLDNRPIDRAGLRRAVDGLRAGRTPQDAVISADARVSHGKVMEVADLLTSLGIRQIGFATSGATAN